VEPDLQIAEAGAFGNGRIDRARGAGRVRQVQTGGAYGGDLALSQGPGLVDGYLGPGSARTSP
jgi:hypothetical protein